MNLLLIFIFIAPITIVFACYLIFICIQINCPVAEGRVVIFSVIATLSAIVVPWFITWIFLYSDVPIIGNHNAGGSIFMGAFVSMLVALGLSRALERRL